MSIQFSVAIPAYNSAAFLAETLESVLTQSHAPAAVVVTDDGSTDGTRDVLAAYADRISIVRIDNSGPGIARKHAVERCETDWIALCDSDDLWHPDHLARKRQLIEGFDDVQLTFANFSSFGPGANGRATHLEESPARWLEEHGSACFERAVCLKDAYRALLQFNVAYPSGTAFRRALYEACGGIRPQYSRWLAEDAEFTRRLALKAGPSAIYDPDVTWRYRRHPQNYSTPSEFRNIVAGVRILEEHLSQGEIPEALRAEVEERIVQRNMTAFLRAYWGHADEEATEIARRIPLARQFPRIWPRALICRLRARFAARPSHIAKS